jgi:hypothetical protein
MKLCFIVSSRHAACSCRAIAYGLLGDRHQRAGLLPTAGRCRCPANSAVRLSERRAWGSISERWRPECRAGGQLQHRENHQHSTLVGKLTNRPDHPWVIEDIDNDLIYKAVNGGTPTQASDVGCCCYRVYDRMSYSRLGLVHYINSFAVLVRRTPSRFVRFWQVRQSRTNLTNGLSPPKFEG